MRYEIKKWISISIAVLVAGSCVSRVGGGG